MSCVAGNDVRTMCLAPLGSPEEPEIIAVASFPEDNAFGRMCYTAQLTWVALTPRSCRCCQWREEQHVHQPREQVGSKCHTAGFRWLFPPSGHQCFGEECTVLLLTHGGPHHQLILSCQTTNLPFKIPLLDGTKLQLPYAFHSE